MPFDPVTLSPRLIILIRPLGTSSIFHLFITYSFARLGGVLGLETVQFTLQLQNLLLLLDEALHQAMEALSRLQQAN